MNTYRPISKGSHDLVFRTMQHDAVDAGLLDAGVLAKLKELQKLRVVADYELDPGNSQNPNIKNKSNWQHNWQRVEVIVQDIYPKLRSF
jgi:hypothetical protein